MALRRLAPLFLALLVNVSKPIVIQTCRHSEGHLDQYKEVPMNITIFGATGGTGRALVDQALAAGHHVTALVRTPATLAVTHAQLCVLQGDIHDADQVAAAIVGQDAILSALGTNQRGPVSLCTDGIAHILPAMTRYSVRRLIAMTVTCTTGCSG